MDLTNTFNCEQCNQNFKQIRYLKVHLKNIHGEDPTPLGNLTCSYCSSKFKFYDDLREHLVSAHNHNIFMHIKSFKEQDDFFKWKEENEKELNCSYVKHTTAKKLRGNITKTYFFCHRNSQGNFCLKDYNSRKRQIKKQGSEKIDTSCPSTLELVCENGKFKGILFLPHVGHDSSLKHINLTKAERMQIAGKIAEGVSFNKILDDIRNNLNQERSLERIHLLNKQDLRNIQREFSVKREICFYEQDVDHEEEIKQEEGPCQLIIEQNSENTRVTVDRLKSKLDTLYALCSDISNDESIKKLEAIVDKAISIAKNEPDTKNPKRQEPTNTKNRNNSVSKTLRKQTLQESGIVKRTPEGVSNIEHSYASSSVFNKT